MDRPDKETRSRAQAQALETFVRLLDKDTSDSNAARLTAILQAIDKDWPTAHECPKRELLADLDERKQLLDDWTASCRHVQRVYKPSAIQPDYEPSAIDISLFCLAPISSLRDVSRKDSPYMTMAVYDTITKNPHEAILWFLGKGPKRPATAGAATALMTTPAKKILPVDADAGPSFQPQDHSPKISSPLNEATKRKKEDALSPSLPPTKHRRVASDPVQVGGNYSFLVQKPRAVSTTSSMSSTPSLVRSKKAVAATLARDNGKCVLTGLAPVEAAHIFPYSATKAPEIALKSITNLVSLWPTNQWASIIADKEVTESPRNLLCLNRHLHALWGSASFGLKPLTTEDEAAASCSVQIQFYWLPKGRYKPTEVVPIKKNEDLHSALCSDNIGNDCMAHRASGVPIESGDIFTITADNPNDLPSVELLQLQWVLTQMASMAGFAQLTDDDLLDDTDADDGAICEETEERDWTVYEGHYLRNWLNTQQSVEEDGRPEFFFGPITSDDEGLELNDSDQNEPDVRENAF